MDEQYGYYGKKRLLKYEGPDGIIYMPHAAYSDASAAAAALMRIQGRNLALIQYLKQNQLSDIRTLRLLKYYNPDRIWENSPSNLSGDTAYVINKGQEFRMCLRDKTAALYDDSYLTFVQFHELAHIASQTYDHDMDFWTNFKWMLKQAEKAGLYTPTDYSVTPFTYCKLYVDYNPYFDALLPDDYDPPA
jgi:hypothetical protein